MISRRNFAIGLISAPLLFEAMPLFGQNVNITELSFDQLLFPPFEALDNPEPFGYSSPNEAQKRKAMEIINTTPKGPKAIDIAQSFIDRFYKKDPEAISQWPAPRSWNPLIKTFFSATVNPANNDMIPWCAAFVNWCIERSGRNGSRSASSQSFLNQEFFKNTDSPQIGDLIIFTCYDKNTDKSLGIGHVAFVKELPESGHVKCIGGNQSFDGKNSIVCEKPYRTSPFEVNRIVNGKHIPCTMRINTFIRLI